MECEICLHFRFHFMITCINGHSFCETCHLKIENKCPLCRYKVLPFRIKDRTRLKIIEDYLDSFYDQLKIGDIIEAKDSDANWYESIILDKLENKVFVHYFGWSSKWNQWRPLHPEFICPKGTHTNDDWYKNIKINDEIEFRLHPINSNPKWYLGVVESISLSGKYLWIVSLCNNKKLKIKWNRDTLCKPFTHCKSKK